MGKTLIRASLHCPLSSLSEVDLPSAGAPEDGADRPAPGARIGHYRILGKLGEGGMGVVFEAEQDNPRRRVALKVVRGGALLDDVQVRMFQREAETLARLEHPGIAAIHEAGRTDDGQHFFAMELVRGRTLDGWLADRPSPPDAEEIARRLVLFRGVCEAVQYAHQRGVIHRDLKPSNLVVMDAERTGSSADGAPLDVVKVLDFGLARITDTEAGTGGSLMTEVGVIKGTLDYMSPEQARGDPAEIDTRTDVYSLGVILCELLTGELPLDFAGASVIESLHIICEQTPRALADLWKGAGRIDPDLATITRKALEKDPDQRYSSAGALAEDIDRFLGQQPILARAPSTIYQLRKLIARRKGPFAAALAGLILLIAFGISMSVLYARSERNLSRALEAESAAEENFRFARDAVDRYFTRVSESPELTAHGLENLRRELLETAREFYTDLVARRRDEGALQAELGAAHIRLSNISRVIGEHEAAVPVALEGIRIFDELVSLEPGNRTHRRELAAMTGNLALLYSDMGRDEEAERAFRDAVVLDEALATGAGADDSDRSRLGLSLDNFAQLLERLARLDEARSFYERAIEVREALPADLPDNAGHRRELLHSYNNYGIFFARQGQLAEAEPPLVRALPLAEELVDAVPEAANESILAVTSGNLAGVQLLLGEIDAARELYERELTLRRSILRRHPAVLEYRVFLGTVLCNLGELETRAGRPEQSLDWFEEAIERFEGILATVPTHATARHSLSYTLAWRARAFEALDDPARAADDWAAAIEYDDRGDPTLLEGLERARRAR